MIFFERISTFNRVLFLFVFGERRNRERIFIVGFLNKKDYENFKWPNKIALTKTIDKVVDWDAEVDKKYLYGSEKKCYELLKENSTIC